MWRKWKVFFPVFLSTVFIIIAFNRQLFRAPAKRSLERGRWRTGLGDHGGGKKLGEKFPARERELRLFLRFWGGAKCEGPGRLGSPYLFALCDYASQVLFGSNCPDWIMKRVEYLAPRNPEPPEGIDIEKRMKEDGTKEVDPKDPFMQDLYVFHPVTGKEQALFGDRAMELKLEVLYTPDMKGMLEKERVDFLNSHYSVILKALKKEQNYLALSASLDFEGRWYRMTEFEGFLEESGELGKFHVLDREGNEKTGTWFFMKGKMDVPFLEKNGSLAFRLGFRESKDIFFYAVMPERLNEAAQGWPKLLGKGEIWWFIDALNRGRSKALELSFPKFMMTSVLEKNFRLKLNESGSGKEADETTPLLGEIRTRTRISVDEGGVSFHTEEVYEGCGTEPPRKKVCFDRPFLFLIYHRRMDSILLLGEFMGWK